PRPVEDGYPRMLSVRDLASGYQLCWRPVPGETAEAAAGVLAGLFVENCPPLVLKTDNGSGLRAAGAQALLQMDRVLARLAPARTPESNGAVEAGIGAVKERTEEHAQRRGSPSEWSWEDAAGARQDGNTFGRSPIDPSRSPKHVWQAREPIRPEDRVAL